VPDALQTQKLRKKNAPRCSETLYCAGKSPHQILNTIAPITYLGGRGLAENVVPIQLDE
jgi:hypothetical protein